MSHVQNANETLYLNEPVVRMRDRSRKRPPRTSAHAAFNRRKERLNGAANAKELLEECERCGAFVVMGSDSHWGGDAGALANCETLIEQTGFPKELVLNYRDDGLAFILRNPLEE